MIYWDHLCHKFAYMKKKDSNRYRREMCMLKKCLRVSRLTCAPNTCHIEQGDTLELGDVSLYPLLFGFHDKDCHAQTILQLSKTCKNNLGLTPYFFQNRQLRDDVFQFLRSSKESECSIEAGCEGATTSLLSCHHSLSKTGEEGGDDDETISSLGQHSCHESGLEEEDDVTTIAFHPCHESGLEEEDNVTTISDDVTTIDFMLTGMTLSIQKAQADAQKDTEIAALRAEKDAEIAALCAEKDAEIAALCVEKDAEIAALRVDKDAEIAARARMESEIAALHAEIAALRGDKDAEIAARAGMESEIAALREQLSLQV